MNLPKLPYCCFYLSTKTTLPQIRRLHLRVRMDEEEESTVQACALSQLSNSLSVCLSRSLAVPALALSKVEELVLYGCTDEQVSYMLICFALSLIISNTLSLCW